MKAPPPPPVAKKGKKKGKKKGRKKGAKGVIIEDEDDEEEEEEKKPQFDPVKHMRDLVKFNDEEITPDLPSLRFMPNKGVLERLIIRVSFAKGP